MGKALVLFDADYSSVGHGQATYTGPSDLQAIVIFGPSVVIGEAQQYTAVCYPPNTTHTSVTWSISSGSEYASISSGGVLTVDESASGDSVVIVATSTSDSTIKGEKALTVTYGEPSNLWTVALADSDFSKYMTGMTRRYELASPITKDGTQAAESVTNPVTSASQNYVVLFDATFPVQVNTDNPGLFFRLGVGACLMQLNETFFFFKPKFGSTPDDHVDIGIPVGQSYRAKILMYWNATTHAFAAKNLVNGTLYTHTYSSGVTGTAYSDFYIGGGGSSVNYYNGTIYQFIVGTT